MFSAHMDTVGPCEVVKTVVEEDRITSDGTTILGGDDKAGIAAILEMLEMIKEENLVTNEIVVVFSIAEEIRLLGAQAIEMEKFDIKYA